MGFHFGLYFNKNDKDFPPQPFFRVYVKNGVLFKYKNDTHEQLALTPQEFDPNTTECQIDMLIKELEDIKRELRTKFRAYERSITPKE